MSRPEFDTPRSVPDSTERDASFDIDRSDNAETRKFQASVALGVALLIDVGVLFFFIIAGALGGGSSNADYSFGPPVDEPAFDAPPTDAPSTATYKDKKIAPLLSEQLMPAYFNHLASAGTPPVSLFQVADSLDDKMRRALSNGEPYQGYHFYYYSDKDPATGQFYASFTAIPINRRKGASSYFICSKSHRVYAIDSAQLFSEPRYIVTIEVLESDPAWRAID
ncbi:MAG: hypothetical protein ABIH86_06925 [Planctomycetota bacterium]